MDITILLKGVFVGLLVAIPVGPIAILCMQRTLTQGQLYGFMFGLGVATADAIYGSIAAFGVTFISNFLIQKHIWIKFFGSLFLIILGSRIIFKEKLINTTGHIKKTNLFNDYTSALFITLTNPITILAFASMFSWNKLNIGIDEISYTSAALLVSGIFIGSALWFTILTLLVGFLKNKFSPRYLKWINNLSGTIIIIVGIIMLISISKNYLNYCSFK